MLKCLSITDFSVEEIAELLAVAEDISKDREKYSEKYKNKIISKENRAAGLYRFFDRPVQSYVLRKRFGM